MTDDLTGALVPAHATLRDVLKSLDHTGFGVALMVDDAGRLTGLFTDGDVRRAIIAGTALDEGRIQALVDGRGQTGTRRPVVVGPDATSAEVHELMETTGVRHVPVLDGDGRPIGLHLWSRQPIALRRAEPQPAAAPLPHPVLVMAGGRGERLRPLTDDVPKPMLEVQGRPLLEGILRQLARSGFRRVTIAVHHRAERIVEHFGDGRGVGLEIEYLHEDRPRGTGGALALVADQLTEPVLVVNGDILTWMDFGQLVRFHDRHFGAARHRSFTLATRRYSNMIPFGVVEVDGSRVVGITEKPEQTMFVNAGVYVVGPDVARLVTESYCDMPTLVQRHLAAGGEVAAYPITEPWLDIGTPAQYAHAQTVSPKGYPDVH